MRFSRSPLIECHDNSDIKRNICWPQLTFWNSYLYAEEQSKSYYVFQLSHNKTNISFQIVVYIEKTRLNLFRQGIIKQWPIPFYSLSEEDLKVVITILYTFLKKETDLISLKIQPYLPGKKYINNLKPIFFDQGFITISSSGAEQTRFMDLRPSLDDILKSFSPRRRSKFFIKKPDELDVLTIHNPLAIPSMQDALDDAFLRSVNKKCPYHFAPFLNLFNKNSKCISIFGFFFKDNLVNPKAFVAGINHGPIFEYSIAGSLSDERLRKFEFNHILLWKLIEQAKKEGCDFFDLGGITPENPENPTASISRFKRNFPGFEVTVLFEIQRTLKPIQFKIYQIIRFCVSIFRKVGR